MSDENDAIQELSLLLREASASARVSPERIVRSTLYDVEYHISLIACALIIVGKDEETKSYQIVGHWLKILQFIAVRPSLLNDFKTWVAARKRPDLDSWQKMPRGYLGDTTHDKTVELLAASKMLGRRDDLLIEGARFSQLRVIYEDLATRNLFLSERRTLSELSAYKINKTLLSGK